MPFGTPLRELLELAGAAPPKAVLLGGAAGSFLRPDQLDLPLTFEDARAAGATLGSGVVIVYDESADLVDACSASRSSSATSRAVSACRAASARCARRRRCTGSP